MEISFSPAITKNAEKIQFLKDSILDFDCGTIKIEKGDKFIEQYFE